MLRISGSSGYGNNGRQSQVEAVWGSSRSGVWACKDGCNAAVVETGQRQSPGWNRALRRVLAPSSQHSHSYSSTTYAQAAAAAGIVSSSPFTPISCRAIHVRLSCIVAMSLAKICSHTTSSFTVAAANPSRLGPVSASKCRSKRLTQGRPGCAAYA